LYVIITYYAIARWQKCYNTGVKLFIDTAREDVSSIRLNSPNGEIISQLQFEDVPNDSLLSHIHTVFNHAPSEETLDITEIEVVVGPGNRFTRTRLGVALANAMGFAYGTKVNGSLFAVPKYHKDPTITKPKK
jgi:tRNA A37 threonylcarbamoyladenosine modification protein TsaB